MFNCKDAEISYDPGHNTYSLFAYAADVPYEAVIIVSFCLPPFVVSFAKQPVSFVDESSRLAFQSYVCLLNACEIKPE